MPSLKTIDENLVRAERAFLVAANEISAEQWHIKPGEGRWSAGELVCHLIQVERTIILNLGKVCQRPPKPRTFFKRFHLPMVLVETRLIPRKTPIPLDLTLLGEKDNMLAQLQAARKRTRCFLEECGGKDLRKHHMPHPFLGSLNMYEWLQLIASHQLRHAKQMEEIAAALPKTVATLQK